MFHALVHLKRRRQLRSSLCWVGVSFWGRHRVAIALLGILFGPRRWKTLASVTGQPRGDSLCPPPAAADSHARFSAVGRWQPHRSRRTRAALAVRRDRLRVHRLPAYAPELKPDEWLWAWLKQHALRGFCPPDLNALQASIRPALRWCAATPPSFAPSATPALFPFRGFPG
jgi:DDE superfamily endonuclease